MLFPILASAARLSRSAVSTAGRRRFRIKSSPRDNCRSPTAPRDSVAVLGEPGIGKSRAVRDLTAGDSNVINVGLDTVADVHDLQQPAGRRGHCGKVDEGAPSHRITVVLDSIDECPIPTRSCSTTWKRRCGDTPPPGRARVPHRRLAEASAPAAGAAAEP